MHTIAIGLILTCATLPLHAQSPAPKADTPGHTATGIAYTQPKDWRLTSKSNVTLITAPEGDLTLAIVQIGTAASAQEATARAWELYRPGFAPVARLVTAASPQFGWQERVSFAYETPPAAKRVAAALALRNGTAWTVMLVDGAQSTAGKRSAAASLIQQSLLPAGYQKENFAGRVAHHLTPERVALVRQFLERSISELRVPGVGVALIDGPTVVWEGGVGVRRLGSPERVDAHTRFMIASNTKGMSTLLLATLVDEGKLRWDQPVTQLYPSFKLGDEATTRATLVRHLVCACTGLPRKDFAFILSSPDVPATETFRQLAATQPTSKFGELFQYNNLMASAAGYLGGSLVYPGMEIGAAYDKAMQKRVFDPLGMHDTGFDSAKAMSGDWARPHGYDIEGQVVEMSNNFNKTIGPYRPAGGAWSSAADMARYAQLELYKGVTPEGKRFVSQANLLERRKRGVQTGENSWYGMGLFNEIEWGIPVVTHGGTLEGYHSDFWVLPDANIAAVLLTNSDSGAVLLHPFFRRLMEILYDGKPEAAAEVASLAVRATAQAKVRRAHITYPGDQTVLANLAMKYCSPEVGEMSLRHEGGQLRVTAGSIEGPVATRRNDDGTMSLLSVGPGAIGLDAAIGGTAGDRTLTVRDAQHEYVYTEVK